jgi:protein-tyrosine-phosphatase
MSDPSSRKRILFVCGGNNIRSPMAEAFARVHGGDRVEVISAGSHPAERIHPRAILFMDEIDYDISSHRCQSVDEVPAGPYEALITLGEEVNPSVQARIRERWDIPDPKELSPVEFRAVRRLIESKVKDLLARL